MPYKMSLPNGGFVMVPDGVPREEAMHKMRLAHPDAFNVPKPEPTISGSFMHGLKSLGSNLETGVESLFGDKNKAAIAAAERSAELDERYGTGSDWGRVKEAFANKGILSGLGEVARQSALTAAESVPAMGAMAAGTALGGLPGLAAAAYAPRYGSGLESQAATQEAAGKTVDVDRGKAALYAAPQAAVDVAANLVPFGRAAIGKVLGPTVEKLLARGATKEAEIAARGALKSAGVGVLKNAAEQGVLQPTQVLLSRLENGQDLTSDDALAEYGHAAYTAGLMSPLGAIGGLHERSAARGAIAERDAAERAAAGIGPPKPTAKQIFDRDFVGPPKPPEFVGPPEPPAEPFGPPKPTKDMMRQAEIDSFVGPARPTKAQMRQAAQDTDTAEREAAEIGPPTPTKAMMRQAEKDSFVGPPTPTKAMMRQAEKDSFVGPPTPTKAMMREAAKETAAREQASIGPKRPTPDQMYQAGIDTDERLAQEAADQSDGGVNFMGPPTPTPAQFEQAAHTTAMNKARDVFRGPDLQTGSLGNIPSHEPVAFTLPEVPKSGESGTPDTGGDGVSTDVPPPTAAAGIAKPTETEPSGLDDSQRNAAPPSEGAGNVAPTLGKLKLNRKPKGAAAPSEFVGPPTPTKAMMRQAEEESFVGPPKPKGKKGYNETDLKAAEMKAADDAEGIRHEKIRGDVIKQVESDPKAKDPHYRRGYLEYFADEYQQTNMGAYGVEPNRAYNEGQHTARSRYLKAKLADKIEHGRDVGELPQHIEWADKRLADAQPKMPKDYDFEKEAESIERELNPPVKEGSTGAAGAKRDVIVEKRKELTSLLETLVGNAARVKRESIAKLNEKLKIASEAEGKILSAQIADLRKEVTNAEGELQERYGPAIIDALLTARDDRKAAIKKLASISKDMTHDYYEQQEASTTRSRGRRKTRDMEDEEVTPELTGDVSMRARPDRYSSRGKTGRSSVDEIAGELTKTFGIHAKRLLDSGKVKIVRSVDDLPPGDHFPTTRGVVMSDTAYIVGENIKASEAKDVLLHEVGAHMGMEDMLKKGHFERILKDFAARAAKGDKPFVDAMRLAEKEVPNDHPDREQTVQHEALAYLIESRGDLGFVRRILSEVKVALNEWSGGRLFNLNADDLRTAAIAGLRRVGRATERESLAETAGNKATTATDTLEGEIPEGHGNALARYSTASADDLRGRGDEDLHYAEPDKTYLGKAHGFISNMIPTLRDAYHNLLSLNQLDTLYGDKLPPLRKLNELMNQRGASLAKRKQALSDNISRWYGDIKKAKISDADLDKFNDLATRSTVYQVEFLDRPEVKDASGTVTQRGRKANTDHLLYQQFDELTRKHPLLKQIYEELRNDYDKHSDELLDRLTAPLNQTAAQKLRLQYESDRIKVYLPLYRRGNFWLSYVDSDGEVVKSAFPSVAERDKAIAAAKAEGATDVKPYQRVRDLRRNSTPPTGFLGDVLEALGKAGVKDESLLDSVYESYLNYMPAGSVRQRFRSRQNVKGMEKDVFNAYANVASSMASNLNNLEYARPVEETVRDLRASAAEPENQNDVITSAMKTIEGQVEYMRNPKISEIANKVGKASYMWYLAGNASSAFVNATHLPMVVHGLLMKKNANWGEVTAAMFNATRKFKLKNADTPPAGYEALFKAADDAGALGSHVGQELFDARTTSAADYASRKGLLVGDKFHDRKALVDTAMNGMFRTADRLNREVALMAAYDLAKKRGLEDAAAHNEAIRTVNDAYGSSLIEVGPRFLQNDIGRVAFTFKRFAMNRLFILAQAFKNATVGMDAETRSAARRQLLSIYGMAFLFSGVSGMPLVGAAQMLGNLVMGDKDDPYDAEEELHKAMGDWAYKGPLGSMLNEEISTRTGWNDMLWKDNPKRMAEVGLLDSIGERMMGPGYSILSQGIDGLKAIHEGNYERAFENMTPSAIRNVAKGFRFLTEGATNRNGDKIVDNVNTFNAFMQIGGFQPQDLADAKAKAGVMKQAEKALTNRRTALLDQVYAAQLNGNADGINDVMDSISSFNEKNPEIAITSNTIQSTFRNRQKKSEMAVDGVYLNPKLRARFMEKYGANDEN
jgi:hypothetical protein